MAIKYIKRTVSLDGGSVSEDIQSSFFNDETSAHVFIVDTRRDGGAFTLTGTVSAIFHNANNTDVVLIGSLVSGAATVTLSDACYQVSGRFTLTISVDGDVIYECNSRIRRRSSGTAYDPSQELTVAALAAAVAEMRSATADAATAADAANTAAEQIEYIAYGINLLPINKKTVNAYGINSVYTNGTLRITGTATRAFGAITPLTPYFTLEPGTYCLWCDPPAYSEYCLVEHNDFSTVNVVMWSTGNPVVVDQPIEVFLSYPSFTNGVTYDRDLKLMLEAAPKGTYHYPSEVHGIDQEARGWISDLTQDLDQTNASLAGTNANVAKKVNTPL
ncbi:MAG: hypothetical protein II789_05945, partial [Clostridia bacterium]|nr:hypothetical protein [Clostridia bacterium]